MVMNPLQTFYCTCSGAVDLSPGCDDDVDAVGVGVGVRAGDVRGEEVEVDVVSTGRKTEHQTALLTKQENDVFFYQFFRWWKSHISAVLNCCGLETNFHVFTHNKVFLFNVRN